VLDRLRSVVPQRAIEKHDLGRALLDLVLLAVERTLGRGDQQSEHERGQRGEQTHSRFEDVLRVLVYMMIGQDAAHEHAQYRAAQHAGKDDERNQQCTQGSPFQYVIDTREFRRSVVGGA